MTILSVVLIYSLLVSVTMAVNIVSGIYLEQDVQDYDRIWQAIIIGAMWPVTFIPQAVYFGILVYFYWKANHEEETK